MCQKRGGDCGLWVLIEIIQKKCHENMKKIVEVLWELPAPTFLAHIFSAIGGVV